MTSLFVPDQAAKLTQPWDEAFRLPNSAWQAQRDVGLKVPINFNTVPGVSLRAACFAHNRYEDAALQKCFSNLLAAGFKRFLVDVYWDSKRTLWSLCPVEIPPDQLQSSSSARVSGRNAHAHAHATSLLDVRDLLFRQDETASRSTTLAPTIASSVSSPVDDRTSPSTASSSRQPSPSVTGRPTTSDHSLIHIGNYDCTKTVTLRFLAAILDDHFSATDSTTNASMTYLVLDVHAASSYDNPNAPAPSLGADVLPSSGKLISDVLKGNLSEELYTPDKLRSHRANLDDSWFNVPWDQQPAKGYYRTQKIQNGDVSTPDGWPTEAFVEFGKYYRVVSGFGTVDSQMANYNMSADLGTLFPADSTRSQQNTTFSSAGSISSGCLFSPSDRNVTASSNSSWAVGTASSLSIDANPDLMTPLSSVANLTSCGISPILNSTLADVTADQNVRPYLDFVYSTLWTWAPGQPLNVSGNTRNVDRKCTAMYATSSQPGRWRSIDCTARHRAACQHPDNPYQWELSSATATYFSSDSACRAPLIFSVPHTALENAHLLSALQNTRDIDPSDPVFLNLNSIDTPGCWVTGINATCPYLPRQDINRVRVVVVPTIAAVIIFVLAALTFFVKCAANRREDKRGRQRRFVGGWEYEGVPS